MELGAAYVLGVLFCALIGVLNMQSSVWREQKLGARLIFLSPVWFVPAAVALYYGVRWLWRQADWKGEG